MEGKLILIVGPSGSGKNTLIKYIHRIHPEFRFPISATTRNLREGDVDGETYHFFTKEEFQKRVDNDEFIEWAVFDDNFYGMLKSEILQPLEEGKILINDVEVQGARIVRNLLPKENFFTIFINAGTWEDLTERILERHPMSEAELQRRHARFLDEMTFEKEADYVIINEYGKIEEAEKKIEKVVSEILEK